MRRNRFIAYRSIIAVVVTIAAIGPSIAHAQDTAPVPPPPVAPPPPPATAPVMAPAPTGTVPISPSGTVPMSSPTGTVPIYQTNAHATRTLPQVVPVMLGTGLAILGGFTIAGTTAFILDNDDADYTGGGITAITFAYIFGGAFSIFGLYLAIGGLADAVHIESYHPGWAWTAAIASVLGGITAVAAVTLALVDDHIGDDTIGFGIAASALYLCTLFALIGLDKTGSSTVSFAPVPLEGGAGLAIAGRL